MTMRIRQTGVVSSLCNEMGGLYGDQTNRISLNLNECCTRLKPTSARACLRTIPTEKSKRRQCSVDLGCFLRRSTQILSPGLSSTRLDRTVLSLTVSVVREVRLTPLFG